MILFVAAAVIIAIKSIYDGREGNNHGVSKVSVTEKTQETLISP